MKLIVALTLITLATTAFATGEPEPPKIEPAAQSVAGAAALSGSKSGAHATGGNSIANGGASSATQTQSAQSSATASNAGNAQNLSIESRYEDRLQAPSAYAPAVYASGPCAYGWSAAISVPGGSLGGGKAKADPACDRREVARVLTPLNPQLALKVLCADPIVAEVADKETDCRYVQAAEQNLPPDPAKYVTWDALIERDRERDRRIMQKATGK